MSGGSPFYRSYSPYLHTSYQPPQPQYYTSGYQNHHPVDLDRARALAAQRARRAQWLPDEYDEGDDYGNYQFGPHERAYLNAHHNHALMEREQRRREQEADVARRRDIEEQKWQQELDRKRKEDWAARKRLEEERERRRQQQVLEFQPPIHAHTDKAQQKQQSHAQFNFPPRIIPVVNGSAPPHQSQPEQRPISPQQSQPSRQSAPAPIRYGEKHVEAALVLQRFFRVRQSIHAIRSLVSEFNSLRRDFTYPSTISFQNPLSPSADVVNVAAVDPSSVSQSSLDDTYSTAEIPKLAFNSTNYDILAYNDALDKLLVKLDGVESWGDLEIRRRRRNVVKQIEREQMLADRFWKTSWLRHNEE